MLMALNAGCSGMATLHANGPDEALWRLESLAAMNEASVAADTLRSQIRAEIEGIVSVRRRGALRAREGQQVPELARSVEK
jgi:Flp pilus assembly CpaF family ATPase